MLKKIALLSLFGSLLFASSINRKSDLIFSHKYHIEEVGAECETCHAQATFSQTGKDDMLPTMETCYSCHDQEETSCNTCHKHPDKPVILPRIENYAVKFNHKIHSENRIKCKTCHSGISAKTTATSGLHLPKMAACMNCHQTPQTVNGCYNCHTRDDLLKPADHNLNWTANHGMASESGSQKCSTCHSESYCTTCHQGENLFGQSHPPDFIATHALSFQMRESNCFTCHEGKDYCVECHMDVNYVKPISHSQMDWLSHAHAQAARSDYDRCTLCHQPGDLLCSQCHN